MRRSRRKLLRWFGGLGLLVAGLGGAAATGHLPPFNHWVEGRLLAALRSAGLQTEDTQLRELSWRRAVVGPMLYRADGLELRLDEARAELGWSVLLGRSAPRIVAGGLVAEVDLARWNRIADSLMAPAGGPPPSVALAIERGRVVLRQGSQRIELGLDGSLDLAPAAIGAELKFDAPALRGQLALHAQLGADAALELELRDGDFSGETWSILAAELLAAPQYLPRFAAGGRFRLSGTAKRAGGRWAGLHSEARVPAGAWRFSAWDLELGAATLKADFDGRGWRDELRAGRARLTGAGWAADLRDPVLTQDGATSRLQFAGATLSGPETRLELGGEISVGGFGKGGPLTAGASLALAGGSVAGWTVAEAAALDLRWDGSALVLSLPSLSLAGACPVRLAEIEATAGGWAQGAPQLLAKGQVAVAAAQACANAGPGWQFSPELVAAGFTANATLGAGAEAARIQFALPAQRRALVFPGGRFEAVLGGEAVLNVDREHVSGRAAFDLHEIIGRCGAWSALAPDAALEVRWPRVWQAALRRWPRAPGAELWRDVLWAGDYDVKTADAIVRHGEGRWCATGLGAQFRARGAELHETGGLALGIQIADLVDGAGFRATQLSLAADGGLSGGTFRFAGMLPDLGLEVTAEQVAAWGESPVVEGSFGFAPVVLTGEEPLARWWPALGSLELTGGVGLDCRDRYADGAWTLGGDLILQDFGIRAPAQQASVEGIRGRVSWSGPGLWRTAPEQTLTFFHASAGTLELIDGSVTFGLEAPGALSVSQLRSGALGGTVEVKPFAVDLRHPELDVGLLLNGVKLEQLLPLFDDVPAEAWGAMDGFVPVRWSEGRLALGTGYLRLAPGELGRMRFTRDLRLLTSGRKPGGAEYSALRRVEQAMTELVFNRLQIDTYPKDESGRSAQIRLVGVPADGEQRMPVSLDVNVNAPLEHFLNLGRGRTAAP